jgi:hypothetical protein
VPTSEEEINLRFTGLTEAERELNDVARGATRAARITDHLARAFDNLEEEANEAQRALDRVNDEIAQNGPTAELNAELARLQHRLSEISGERFSLQRMQAQFRQSTASAAQLDHEIEQVREELSRLNREYAQGGDPAVLEQLRAQQRELDRLNNTRRRIAQEDQQEQLRLARMAEEARRAQARRDDEERRRQEEEDNRSFLRRIARRARNLGDGAGGGLQGMPLPGPGLAAGAAIGTAAAVPLLAAIGGALTGIVGGGVATAGIAGAVMGNPEKFKSEWSAAAGTVKSEFLAATGVFEGPALEAIRGIGPVVKGWGLGEVFADAARFVKPLTSGVEGFATGIIRGVSAMTKQGGPAVEALAEGLAEIGEAAGDAFEDIADGAEGGAAALEDTITAVSTLVRVFGAVTGAAEKAYSFVRDHPIEAAIGTGGLSLGITYLDAIGGRAEALPGKFITGGNAAEEAAKKTEDSWEGAAAAMEDAADAADHLYDAQTGLARANIGWEQSIDDLSESIKENGKNWDISTEKGRNNTEALLDSIDAAKRTRDANIENGMSVADANRAYEAQIEYLRGVATKAGLTQAQFDAMTKALLNYINTPMNKTITTKFVDIHYVSQEGRIGSGEDPRTRTGRAYASGGPTVEGVSLFGEEGPELRFASQGDYIATARQTERILSAAGGRGGGGGGGGIPVVRVILEYPDGRVVRDQLVSTAANAGQTVSDYLGL